jgi:hypothetical protein
MPHGPIVHPVSSDGGFVDCDQLRQDIKRNEDLIVAYNRSLETASAPDVRRDLLNGKATTNAILSEQYAELATHCTSVVTPPPFRIEPWELVSGEGIELPGGAWNTGSVWCVCPLPGDRLLVGTEQGGLWLSQPDGQGDYQSACLSNDWERWKIVSLVADPARPTRVFAGCTHDPDHPGKPGLYSGTVEPGQPSTWTNIPLPPGLDVDGNEMKGLLILPRQRILVVATSFGLGWTAMDPPYAWTSVYYWGVNDLALAADPQAPGRDAFVLVTAGDDPAELMRATIQDGTVDLAPVPESAISWAKQPTSFVPKRVASCRADQKGLYCLGCAPGGLSGSLCVLRSTDFGQTWHEVGYSATDVKALAIVLDFGDSGVKSDYSIAVHPTQTETLAVGYGQAARSTNGGKDWPWNTSTPDTFPGDVLPPGAHSDVHNLLFDETGGLLIPSDGGIALRYADGGFDTRRNRTLPVLMLLEPVNPRQYIGTLSVAGDLIAAGTQDNGILWLAGTIPEWKELATGDGGVNAVSPDAAGTYLLSGRTSPNVPVAAAKWDGASWGSLSTVPILLSDNTTLDTTGLKPQIWKPVVAATGLRAGPNNRPVMALAASGNDNRVYAAVLSGTNTPEWVAIGQVPAGEVLLSLEAHDAATVLVGTVSGRLFALTTGGTSSEIPFPDAAGGNGVAAIASDGVTIACFRRGLYVQRGSQPLARLSGSTFPPNDYADTEDHPAIGAGSVHDLAANRNQQYLRLTFAVTIDEHEVWVSNSPIAAVWHRVEQGLPVGARVGSVVFSETHVSGALWLGTFGRSLWRVPFG